MSDLRYLKSFFPGILLGLATFLQPVPSLANSPLLQNLATDAFETLDDYRRDDQWLIVMIWAHDCEVCEREVGAYQDFHRRHADSDARVLGISLDGEQYKESARQFVDRHGLGYANLIGEPETVVGYYQVVTRSRWIGTPSFLIFGPDGELKARQVGAVEVEIVENFISSHTQ